jgi:hypothetical protein
MINHPQAYSHLLGEDTSREALIQRGATASWTPKNLGSRLILFSCKWMVANTSKRIFVGYGDSKAHEIGTIYQACNFDYLGDKFGTDVIYTHPNIRDGAPFSAQILKRTSAFRKWCRQNGIDLQPSWFKKNQYKDLKAIPTEIKESWYSDIKKTLAECSTIKIGRKHKYALLLAKDKRELKYLRSLKTYKPLPYPKRSTSAALSVDPIVTLRPVRTLRPAGTTNGRCRITKEKVDFITANYNLMTKKEIAEKLGEKEGWVDARIRALIHAGTITPKNPLGSNKSRATQEKLDFIQSNKATMTYQEMADKLGETKRWVKRQIHKNLI